MKQKKDPIKEMSKKHAVIMLGGSCRVINEYIEPEFNTPEVSFSSMTDFTYRYANKSIVIKDNEGKPKAYPLAKVWLDSPLRRQYEGIVFNPKSTPKGYYNLWSGFAVEPKKGTCTPFTDHIRQVICNEDSNIYNWVMGWLARIVQDPGGKRPGTAIVLRGGQGVGKGCFVEHYGKIFGKHFLQIMNSKHLVGHFNFHLKDKLVVYADEGFWAGDKAGEGVLKGMVTEPVNPIEQKGKDVFTVKNRINLIMASNSDWVVPAGFFERRFCVLDVSNKHQEDEQYFDKIYDCMKNGGLEAFLYELLNTDISGIKLGKIPKTAALLDQIIESLSSIESFWYECLYSGQISHDTWRHETKKDVYNKYIDHCNDKGVRHRKTDSQFGKKLKKLCPGIDSKSKITGEYDDTRKPAYKVPELAECRKQFEEALGSKVIW